MRIAVSACLLGGNCRYDGGSRPCQAVIDLASQGHELVPLCPEALGGLSIPREPCEVDSTLRYPRVLSRDGRDVTEAFVKGAKEALRIAQERGCQLAIFKGSSPSCGSEYIHDGSFTSAMVPGSGITTREFRNAGIRVVSEARFMDCNPQALLAAEASQAPSLETERLLLRPMTEEDAQALYEYARNPEVGPDAGWAPHRSVDDSLAYIQTVFSSPHVFGIIEKESAALMGSAGLIPDGKRQNPDCMMLGYALGRQWWGRGYMTEAATEVIRYGFEDLRLSLVTCCHYPFNSRSRRVIEKCGFVYEGVMRGVEATPDGIMQDIDSYSITKQEYFSRRPL